MDKTSIRKVKEGIVVSAKMDKTVVVRVEKTLPHPQYKKVVKRAKKYYAHSVVEGIEEGTKVKIRETRPLSKMKRWLVVEVMS